MGNETMECADCDKVFKAKHLFNKHRKTHDKRHVCPVCSRAFGLKTDLERHSNLHRSSQLIYRCHYPNCKFRGSPRKDHLSAHLKQCHTKNGKLLLGSGMSLEEHQRLIQHQQNVDFLECVRRGDKKMVERFLSDNRSVQVAAQDSAGSTALHICSMKGHTSLITMLLQLGMDVNVLDSYQNTALHLAVTEKKYEVARILIENGANVNVADEKGETALHFAVTEKPDVVQMLLEKGANVNAANKRGETALHFAVTAKKYEVVRILLENRANVNVTNEKGETTLHSAAWIGDEALADLLIDNKADREARCWHSYRNLPNQMSYTRMKPTPLHLAADRGHSDVVGLLLGGGASVDSLTELSYTPLHLAAENGHSAVVGLLLGGGASVDSLTDLSHTPLHLAADKGHSEVVGLLLGGEASVDSLTELNYTPLHLAARSGHVITAKHLMADGANVRSITRSSEQPLNFAVKNGHIEVAKLLLNNGAHVDSKGVYNQTLLHQAARSQNPQCVELILEENAQSDTKDDCGHTPLSYAIGKGPLGYNQKHTHEESTKLLLAAGAEFSFIDWNYLSPEYKNMFAHYRPAGAEQPETSDPAMIPWIADCDEKYEHIVRRYSERGTGQCSVQLDAGRVG